MVMYTFFVLPLSLRCIEFTITKRALNVLLVMFIHVSLQVNASAERFGTNGTFE